MFSKNKDQQKSKQGQGLQQLKDSPVFNKSSENYSDDQKQDDDDRKLLNQKIEKKETDEEKQKQKQIFNSSNQVKKQQQKFPKSMMFSASEKKQPSVIAFLGAPKQASNNVIINPAVPANAFSFGQSTSSTIILPGEPSKNQFGIKNQNSQKNSSPFSSQSLNPMTAKSNNSFGSTNNSFGSTNNSQSNLFQSQSQMIFAAGGLNIPPPAQPKPLQPESKLKQVAGSVQPQLSSIAPKFSSTSLQQLNPASLNQTNNTNNDILQRIAKLENQAKLSQNKFNALKQEFDKYKIENPNKKDYDQLKKQYNQLRNQYDSLKNINSDKTPLGNTSNNNSYANMSNINSYANMSNNNSRSGNMFNNGNISNNNGRSTNMFNNNANSSTSNFNNNQAPIQSEASNMKEIKQSMNKMCEDISKKNNQATETMISLSKLILNSFNQFSNGIALGFGKLSAQIANNNKYRNQNAHNPQNQTGGSWGTQPTNIRNSNYNYYPLPPLFPLNPLPNSSMFNNNNQQPRNPLSFSTTSNQSQANFAGTSSLFQSRNSTERNSPLRHQSHQGYQVTYRINQLNETVDLCISNSFGKLEVLSKLDLFTNIQQICQRVYIQKDCCTFNDPKLQKLHLKLTSYNFMDFTSKSLFEKLEINSRVQNISVQNQLIANINPISGDLIIEMKPRENRN